MTKAVAAMLVSLRKEVNKNYFVRGHQYGGSDVKWKHSIVYLAQLSKIQNYFEQFCPTVWIQTLWTQIVFEIEYEIYSECEGKVPRQFRLQPRSPRLFSRPAVDLLPSLAFLLRTLEKAIEKTYLQSRSRVLIQLNIAGPAAILDANADKNLGTRLLKPQHEDVV